MIFFATFRASSWPIRIGPAGLVLFLSACFVSLLPGRAAEPTKATFGHAVVHAIDAGEAPIKDAVRAIAQARDGTLIVGSNQLAAFDGRQWQRIELPGTYAFRALALAQGNFSAHERVYVGAIGQIGYIEPDQ